ncbi:cyclic nucleotide-binding domain-containing protein [Microdochium bolleyi]|uniref:Cyclic nucleotide-binding domain-containing protein n=1 Tax=Microdochium bolleyi TaxID=196109 RepID=A0A136JF90_9PEZI|nr:cyclic nucleotide-binding domain-containing protein [Microdochium bolleyi]
MTGRSIGFSSWRSRSGSIGRHVQHGDGEDDRDTDASAHPSRQPQTEPWLLSSSFNSSNHREPTFTRSFVPGSVRDHLTPVDSAQYARSVREDTAELASYVLSDQSDKRASPFLRARRLSASSHNVSEAPVDRLDELQPPSDDTIAEVSEPPSPDAVEDYAQAGPSMLTSMFRQSPSHTADVDSTPKRARHNSDRPAAPVTTDVDLSKPSSPVYGNHGQASEFTPLLVGKPLSTTSLGGDTDLEDLEGQKPVPENPSWGEWLSSVTDHSASKIRGVAETINPKAWSAKSVYQKVVLEPVRCLPAVVVGLLLNILDALSYGMILFPLGNPIFSSLGPAGISIFYVSTIVSQLTFSTGSIFRGCVGSELIEVVPFFHSMANKITAIVGEDQPDAVIATTITSFAVSSMLTGVVFYLMGRFRLGYIVGFIPRHILIGCIGGVGWFLIATGFEVSARLDEFHYDLDTLQNLCRPDILPLWIIPLVLAIALFVLQKKITSQYFLSIYIIMIPFVFYFFVFSIDELQTEALRKTGWIFDAPPADEPWWYFWTLYKFHLVRWDAIIECFGAMIALTFFSLLHVPINVPALAQSTGEDNADLNHELQLHGFSNFISGCVGSIQNYLVYANTLFFIRSGGDSRLAGYMLAALTFVVLTLGPVVIGFIPVCMVGTLIFVLGFELLGDALVHPRHKLKISEYVTIVVIVMTMGIYDFVAGIFLGMVLAFISAIFHSSRVPAIRATYTGDQIGSMVRRNPSQHLYLQAVGEQTYIIKLSGFLFFGTIVGVDEKIRALLSDDAFRLHPIRYVVVDIAHVTGLDYTAGEGFMTISRLLNKRGVNLIISGKDADSRIGRDLRAVGLGEAGIEVTFMPDLNSALECCENEQLKTFYAQQEALKASKPQPPSKNLDVPSKGSVSQSFENLSQSPRRSHLHQAAGNVLAKTEEVRRVTRWQSLAEPLRLMLQIFHDLSDKNEDFWYKATPFFARREFAVGTVLYHRGEPANGFYLIERGELRADYETPQGRLSEPIVQGTTCGELPFFSETDRTATVMAVKDCTLWVMDREGWEKLQACEASAAHELLRISLKLTTERLHAMTNYISAVGN